MHVLFLVTLFPFFFSKSFCIYFFIFFTVFFLFWRCFGAGNSNPCDIHIPGGGHKITFLVNGTHIPDINKVGVGGDDIYQYMQVRLSSQGYIAYAGRVSSSGPVIA